MNSREIGLERNIASDNKTALKIIAIKQHEKLTNSYINTNIQALISIENG